MSEMSDEAMAELLKSSMQLDVDTRTFLVVTFGIYTGILLLVWVFTGSHIAMTGFAVLAWMNIREIRKVNALQESIFACDFSEALSITTRQVIRWACVVTSHAENRAALTSGQEK